MGGLSTGFGTNQKNDPAGAPFPVTAAADGLSVDGGTGQIVLGDDGSNLAVLTSDRFINTAGSFSLVFLNGTGLTNRLNESGLLVSNTSQSGFIGPANIVLNDPNSGSSVELNGIGLFYSFSFGTTTVQLAADQSGILYIQANDTKRVATFDVVHDAVQLGDVSGTNNGTTIAIDDNAQTISINSFAVVKFLFDLVNGFLGIGKTPATALDILGSALNGYGVNVKNSNANGFASLNLSNDLGSLGQIACVGSAFIGGLPLSPPDCLSIYNNGAAGVTVHAANPAGVIRFAVNNTLSGSFKSDGTLNLTNVQNFASNVLAIAGGLVVGDVYRTAGALMIVI